LKKAKFRLKFNKKLNKLLNPNPIPNPYVEVEVDIVVEGEEEVAAAVEDAEIVVAEEVEAVEPEPSLFEKLFFE
jgi:hypothetical protein